MRLRIPPGRAGRLWLRERLAAARSAADLLDHKRRELESELHRMDTILGRRTAAWRDAMAEAERWLGRIDTTGGAWAMRIAAALEPAKAQVQVSWRQVMGVHYPTEVDLRVPAAPAVGPVDGGAAVAFARDAFHRATEAAAMHAVARTARARIVAERDRTIRRLRALKLRAVPAHEDALRALELRLEEKDREEAVSARWAAEAQP